MGITATKLRLYFTIGGLGFILLAVLTAHAVWGYVFLWPSLAFLNIALAYEQNLPFIFKKDTTSGKIGWVNTILFLPYLACVWITWGLRELRSDEPSYHEIARGVLLGRYCRKHPKTPPGVKIGFVLDMTTEFSEPESMVKGKLYECIPTLDASSSDDINKAFAVIKQVCEWKETESGKRDMLYIHCAAGHGRSCMMACVYLVAAGIEPNREMAYTRIKSIRERVFLHQSQIRTADMLISMLNRGPQRENVIFV